MTGRAGKLRQMTLALLKLIACPAEVARIGGFFAQLKQIQTD
jgi:hypothetical protein